MWKFTGIVQYVYHHNCFVHINRRLLGGDFRSDSTCIELSWDDRHITLWCVESNVSEGCVGLNSLFAQRIGISEGKEVCISVCPMPPALDKVTIYPDTEEDLELLESNAIKLQACLLDQLRIVTENQNMVIWVSPSLFINIKANKSSVLREQTELVVVLKENDKEHCSKKVFSNDKKPVDTPVTPIKYYMTEQKTILSKYKSCNSDSLICTRAIILTKKNDVSKIFLQNDKFVIYIKEGLLKTSINDVYNIRCMAKADEPKDKNSSSNEIRDDYTVRNIFVKIKLIPNTFHCQEMNVSSKYPFVLISTFLSNLLNIDYNGKLILERVQSNSAVPQAVEITSVLPDIIQKDELEMVFKKYISSQSSNDDLLLLNTATVMNLSPVKNISCQINLVPNNLLYALLTGESLRNCKIIASHIAAQPSDNFVLHHQNSDTDGICRSVHCIESIIINCAEIINADMVLDDSSCGKGFSRGKSHIMLLGSPGSGKTTLCSTVVSDLAVWYMRLGCRSIKGRKDIIDIFQKSIDICEEHCPSILICDDIEALIPRENEGTPHQDAVYFEGLVHSIRSLLASCTGVNVIVTATALDAIHSNFNLTKGEILFTKYFTIPELSQNDRAEILSCIAKNSLYSTVSIHNDDIQAMALDTIGFTPRDLVDYVNKCLFKAVKKAVSNNSSQLKIERNSVIISSKNDDKIPAWEGIGGMEEIKKTLVEILCWPLKYPGLFPKQPGGVLLFGPPGTGKSLIGSGVAKLSQMSFICVKGPELLSKYIGQSEQGVRNLFERAEKKKPCILFFDEFDSLAPRRGHDSTGVTDRVVNQLLTQLDGVEGAIKGVTVVAATSRPDLLDGALLRPGRFDTNIYCEMPNENDRLEILRVLSVGLQLSNDVDLQELSTLTQGFTGADLKAVLSTAQLSCIEEQLELLSADDATAAAPSCVTQAHLRAALSNTRPSLTAQQLQFYDTIYARFLNKPLSVADTTEEKPSFSNRQRATLA